MILELNMVMKQCNTMYPRYLPHFHVSVAQTLSCLLCDRFSYIFVTFVVPVKSSFNIRMQLDMETSHIRMWMMLIRWKSESTDFSVLYIVSRSWSAHSMCTSFCGITLLFTRFCASSFIHPINEGDLYTLDEMCKFILLQSLSLITNRTNILCVEMEYSNEILQMRWCSHAFKTETGIRMLFLVEHQNNDNSFDKMANLHA